jgi:hypothetical protein
LEEEEADKDRVLVGHPLVAVQSADTPFRILAEHHALA